MHTLFHRAPEAADAPVQAAWLEMDPRRIRPALSVQEAWNGSLGLIRGVRENGVTIEDHIREELDERGRVRDAGRRIFGAEEMRRDVWTVERHLAEFAARRPGERVAAWMGNGNLLANPHFAGYQDGTLYCLAGEPAHFAARSYTSLVARAGGVSIETLRYRAPGRVLSEKGADITAEIRCATFGQQIVRGGEPLGGEELLRKASAGEFFDLRHVFLFPRIGRGRERWVDAGLAAFRDGSGGLLRAALEDALNGRPVKADVREFDTEEVAHALAAKGYTPSRRPARPGEYSLAGGALRFVPLPGIYPHSMVGIRADGTLLAVAASGLSNRAGLTLESAAELMRRLGARDAILLDNGGDVTLACGAAVARGRGRLRSLLLWLGDPAALRLNVPRNT